MATILEMKMDRQGPDVVDDTPEALRSMNANGKMRMHTIKLVTIIQVADHNVPKIFQSLVSVNQQTVDLRSTETTIIEKKRRTMPALDPIEIEICLKDPTKTFHSLLLEITILIVDLRIALEMVHKRTTDSNHVNLTVDQSPITTKIITDLEENVIPFQNP